MKRIIIHWTAGGHKPSALDLSHYHYVIDGEGKVHEGKWTVSANAGALVKGQYAAHTLNCNTGSIGISLAAMAGAVERPFSAGKSPITKAQEDALMVCLGVWYGPAWWPAAMLACCRNDCGGIWAEAGHQNDANDPDNPN